MKDCVLARWVWQEISDWWNIPVYKFASANFSLRNLFSLMDDSILNKSWKLVVAESLWHIWISRINKVFSQRLTTKEKIVNSIKVCMYRWLLSNYLVEDNVWVDWKICPQQVIRRRWLQKKDDMWREFQKKL